MGSRDGAPTLPPLIDFGDDNDAFSPSTDAGTFNHTSPSPFNDPFMAFELPMPLSPAGSSSSPFHAERWEHSAAESSPSPFFDEQWNISPQLPLTFDGAECSATRSRSGLVGNCPIPSNSKSKYNDSPCKGNDLLSDISATSVSYPQVDLLSSTDILSQLTPDSKSFSDILSPQSPPCDRLPLGGLDSMLLHTPSIHENLSPKDTDSNYASSGWSNSASFESPLYVSKTGLDLTMESFSNMSVVANDSEDFWSGPFFQPTKEQMSESTQKLSPQNRSNSNGKATDLLDDASCGIDFDDFVEQKAGDGCESSQTGRYEPQCTVLDRHSRSSKTGAYEQQCAVLEEHGLSSQAGLYEQQCAVSEGHSSWDNQSCQPNNESHVHAYWDAGQDKMRSQQRTTSPHELPSSKMGRIKEFIGAGGGKGVFKAPERGADRPVPLELRPQPLKEMSSQPTRVLACTDTAVCSGCEQGIMVWDILSACRSNCDGKANMNGDEDAAAYSFLPLHESAPTCLFTDTANHIMWSGHKDGRVRAWSLSFKHGSESVGNGNAPILTWQAHQTPVLAIVVTSYGELWTGSDNGSIRAWPWDVIAHAFSSSEESVHIGASLVATSYIDLKTRAAAAGASSLSATDVRFLIAEHSQCRVWSGGSHLLAMWDALTRNVLKVFGPNPDAEFISPNISPVREMGRVEEVKMNITRVSKKDRTQGTLSFFQRSRNAVMGAADAVLRAYVGGQSMDDSKKMEALIGAADGNVWVGYANGRLVQWDSFGNQLAEYRHSSTAVRCMCAFGNRIFVGYADGVIHALTMDSGKLLGAWRAHKSSVARVGVSGNHLFTLADNGGIRGWFITSPSTFDTALHSRMISKESTYVRQENIKILAGTWNVGQEKASFDSLTYWLAKSSVEASIIVVGLQEVEMGAGALAMAAAKETVGLVGSVNGQWWLDNIGDSLNGKKQFVRVGSRQLAGLLIGAWVSKELLPYVGGVGVAAVACGFGRAFGNKGAVAVKMMVFRRTVCVVNCHFAAHMDAVAKRNADFDHIYHRMAFGRSYGGVGLAATAMAASAVQIMRGNSIRHDTSSWEVQDIVPEKDNESEDVATTMPELSEADLLIWVGDFNYRLADLPYADAVDLIYDQKWEDLLKKDQLRSEMKAGRVFQGMREAYIMFPPTYKFDKGFTESGTTGTGYDSSEKRRVPAWCDRVLYRDSFDRSELEWKLGLSQPMAASVTWYGACMDAVESDHKPVSCLFDVQVAVINEAARRWEYGKFLRSDPEALTLQKQIDVVPETLVNTTNLKLVDRTMSVLKLSNESAEKWAIYRFHCEGEPIETLSQSHLVEGKHGPCRGCNGLPFWLQVLPASGVLQPGQTIEVTVQYAGSEIPMEDDSSFKKESADLKHEKRAILVIEVKGVLSSCSRKHGVRVSHFTSMSYGDHHSDRGNHSQ